VSFIIIVRYLTVLSIWLSWLFGILKLKLKYIVVISLILSCFMVTLGFNTIDQMIIRYKYYDYQRSLDYWEMSYWWKPNWWDVYILSIFMLVFGSFLFGVVCCWFYGS